jgi:solute carrier family 25 oxoglutarate transporter 11
VAKQIAAADGVGALYKGLSAGLLRQATYTTARLGIFNNLTVTLKEMNGGKNLPLWQKAATGLTAGAWRCCPPNPPPPHMHTIIHT